VTEEHVKSSREVSADAAASDNARQSDGRDAAPLQRKQAAYLARQ
jgi:hypothetical protein